MNGWVRILAAFVVGGSLAAALAVSPTRAQDCDMSCPPHERTDEDGCCPAKPVSKPVAASKPSSPAGWGAAAGAAGCAPGLVVEGGRCCWPGQGWSGAACIGAPRSCPSPLVPQGETCAAASCTDGRVLAPGSSHCCWPGQAWSASGNACVGTPRCPSGWTQRGADCLSAEQACTRDCPVFEQDELGCCPAE